MAGKRSTGEDVEERKEVVERVLLEGRWSLRTQNQLAREFGVTARQIRRYAAQVRADWLSDVQDMTPDDHRARLLNESRALRAECLQIGHTMTAARLLVMEARLTGADSPIRVEHTHRVESLTPPERARAIVGAYDDARAYLEAIEPAALTVIDVEP